MRDKPSPELMRALETLGKRPVQPPATPQEPEQAQTLNDVFDVFETWARRKGATDTSSVSLGFWAFNEFHAIIGQPLRDWLLSRRASTPSPEGQTWCFSEAELRLLVEGVGRLPSFTPERRALQDSLTERLSRALLPSPPTPEGTQP